MTCKAPMLVVFISAALAATGCSQASERLGQPPLASLSVTDQILAADVDAYLQNHVKEGFSGSALLSKGDEVLLHGGYGELGPQRWRLKAATGLLR